MRILLFNLFFWLTCIACNKYYVVNKHESRNIELTSTTAIEDSAINNEIKPYRDILAESMNEILNYSETEMTIGIPEGNLGNFVADIVMWLGTDFYENVLEIHDQDARIDFALLNNGGLRTSLPKGDISRKKIFELMPFENELVILTLTPEKVKDLFEFVALKSDTSLSVKKGVPLSSEVKLILTSQQVKEAYVNKEKITGRNYRIITSDYLANGGDKMDFFLNPVHTEKIGIKLRDAIIEYIVKEKEAGRNLKAFTDNRIMYAK